MESFPRPKTTVGLTCILFEIYAANQYRLDRVTVYFDIIIEMPEVHICSKIYNNLLSGNIG